MKEEHAIPSLDQLIPGDLLLYDRGGIFGTAVKVKTWSNVSHIEVVTDFNTSISAREEGVNEFPIDLHGLRYVLRPQFRISMDEGLKWFRAVAAGQSYHYIGLLSFYLATWQGKTDNKMFCSESVARFLKKCGVSLLNKHKDADTYAPSQFLDSPLVDYVWVKYVEEDWKLVTQGGNLVYPAS